MNFKITYKLYMRTFGIINQCWLTIVYTIEMSQCAGFEIGVKIYMFLCTFHACSFVYIKKTK